MATAGKKDDMPGHSVPHFGMHLRKGRGGGLLSWLLIASWWGVSVLSHCRCF